MNLKNGVKCQNCGEINEYYNEKCKSCKAYLRARVFNIDLWRIIWNIIETPLNAFKEIIFSEHKNYMIFLLIVMGGKYFTNSLIVSNLFYYKETFNETPLVQVIPSIALFIAFIYLLSFLFTKVMNIMGYNNKTKNVLAVLTYTFVPSTLIFVILSPIEFALFGQHWFYHNPEPTTIKAGAAYVLYGVEVLIYLWTCILSGRAFKALTGNNSLSYILGLIFSLLITGGLFVLKFLY